MYTCSWTRLNTVRDVQITWGWMWVCDCCWRCCFKNSLYSRFRSSTFRFYAETKQRHKITCRYINVTTTEFLRSTSTTRSQPYKLYKQHSSCTARFSFFTELVVNIWNSLPVDTDFSSLSGFIRRCNNINITVCKMIMQLPKKTFCNE